MEKLKSRSVQMSRTIDLLKKKFLECIEMAEKNNGMALVIKGNCLKQESIEIKPDLKVQIKNMKTSKRKKRNYHESKSWNL